VPTSLLYVSKSNLTLPEEAGEVLAIVATARRRNAELGVTGALVFTESRFAQVLEGDEEAIDALMLSILKDRRHEQVTVVDRTEVAMRRFPQWSMAYSGPSLYVDRHIKPLLVEIDKPSMR
jgi:hypothetical protein